MLKFLAPASLLSAVLFLTVHSFFNTNSLANSQPLIPNETDTLSAYQFGKLENLEACRDEKIGIYFHGKIITYHSAEIVNETLSTIKTCELRELRIEIFEVNDQPDNANKVKNEIKAYLTAHQISGNVIFNVETSPLTSDIYNGSVAEITFEVDKKAQEAVEKAS